jgi:phage FluMu gp28-like protein
MPRKKAPAIDLSSVVGDPVEFAIKFLKTPNGDPLQPHAGQIELLRNIAKNITICCCGRQWGKSVAMAIYVCWYSVTHAHRQVYIVAPALDQARIIFNEVAAQFHMEPLSALVVGKITEYPFPRIKLANGTEIHGRGANSPQFLRGKKCHLAVVDEAAFCKDSTLTDVIEPMMTVTGKEKDSGILMISTPFGLGAFADYYQQARKKTDGSMQAHHFRSEDNPHADRDFLQRVKDRYGEDSLTWRTEYLAEFVDDDLAVFPSAHLKWSYENYPYLSGEAQNPQFPIAPQTSHRYVQGCDLANQRDYFVSTVFDTTEMNAVVMVQMTRLRKRGYTEYKRIIRETHKSYNNAETLLDATSLGESVAEDLQDISAEGYKFTNSSKHEIISELARMFAEHRLLIPYNREILSELRNLQYEYTKSKTVRIEAKVGHDDIVMSMALSAHLALIPRTMAVFTGFTPNQTEKVKLPENYDPFAALFNDDEEDEYLWQRAT